MKRRSLYRIFRGLILLMAGMSFGILYAKLTPRSIPQNLTERAVQSGVISMLLSPSIGTTNEFQGDQTDLVLRVLGRKAGLKIVLSDEAASRAGTVTMRIEDRSPRQVIDAIIKAKGFTSFENGGVLYIRAANE
jgi:hypothetical protein